MIKTQNKPKMIIFKHFYPHGSLILSTDSKDEHKLLFEVVR